MSHVEQTSKFTKEYLGNSRGERALSTHLWREETALAEVGTREERDEISHPFQWGNEIGPNLGVCNATQKAKRPGKKYLSKLAYFGKLGCK